MLFMVASGRCLAAAEFSRQYRNDASANTRLIELLEKRGLLVRKRRPEDRCVVHSTANAIAASKPAVANGVLDRLLACFTPEQVDFVKSMPCRVLTNSGCDLCSIGRDATNAFVGKPKQLSYKIDYFNSLTAAESTDEIPFPVGVCTVVPCRCYRCGDKARSHGCANYVGGLNAAGASQDGGGQKSGDRGAKIL